MELETEEMDFLRERVIRGARALDRREALFWTVP